MKKHIMIAVLVSVFFVAACKKIFDSVPGQQPVNTPPTPTQVGISTGNAVTKEINSSGGSIVSYDGKLEVIVPSGAVANNTVFGIQPITDFCPGGLSSYRLSPDGMKFSNPVTLKFHYTDDDIDGSMASFLGIAYQDSNNVWQQQTSVVIDSVNKTVSVETTHFTDWSVLESLGITVTGYGKNSVPHVKINQAVEMRLTGKPEDDLPPLPLKDGTPGIPLPEFLPFQAKWYVNGILNGDSHVGEIDIAPAGDGKVVYYKAPVLIPAPSVVTISAELTDFNGTWYSFSNNNKISVNKVILFRRIKVVSDAMNFTFHMESTEDEACGAPGSFSFDQVDMNIKVVGTDVTVTQLTNQQPTIINPSVQSFNCTVTA